MPHRDWLIQIGASRNGPRPKKSVDCWCACRFARCLTLPAQPSAIPKRATGHVGIAGANSGPCAPRSARIARAAPQRSWVFEANQPVARHDPFWKWRMWCRTKLPRNHDGGRFRKLAICRKQSHWSCRACFRKLTRPLTMVSIASIHGAAGWRNEWIDKNPLPRDTTLPPRPRWRRPRSHSSLMSAEFC